MKNEYIAPSEDEIAKIKAGDKVARNKFFTQNYPFLQHCCRTCCYSKLKIFTQSDIDNLINECYVNLADMDLECRRNFITSVYDQLLFYRFGGKNHYYNYRNSDISFPLSLDRPLGVGTRSGEVAETSTSLGDTIPVPSAEEELQWFSDNERVDDVLSAIEPFLAPKELEVMRYRFLTGLSATEIGKELGKTQGSILSQMSLSRKKLVINYKEILLNLADLGFEKSLYFLFNNVIPPDYEEFVDTLNKRREKAKLKARERFASAEAKREKNEKQRLYRAKTKNAAEYRYRTKKRGNSIV